MTAVPVNPSPIVIDLEEAGVRIDRVVSDRLDGLSRSRLKALIEAGRLAVDGATISNPSLRVKPGQIVTLDLPAPVEDRPEAQAIDLVVVYEDEDLIVVDKPAGMVVHPAPGNPDRTLVNALLAHCGAGLTGIGGVRRPGIVHRIDKDTSGLLVAAKTEAAHAGLSLLFATHDIERAYTAIVWGVPSPREGVISAPIGRSRINRQKMAVVASGKPAITHYRVVRPLGLAASHVECRLETGRTHQIRVHMTEAGHALVGDPVYGRARGRRTRHLDDGTSAALLDFPRQALHAGLLGFIHPTRKRVMRFECALPADIEGLIRALE
jgi:23S rRNA pseudouridine1911/1915/1917 synthase